MNRTWATTLLLVFFVAVGLFNIARGRKSIRAKSESTFWGVVRVVAGILLLLLPLPVLFFLKKNG